MRYRQIVSIIKSSFYNPEFYKSVQEENLGDSAKVLIKIVSVGAGILAVIAYIAIVMLAVSDFPSKVADAFPNDLVVTVASSTVSVNQTVPYYVNNALFTAGPKYLAVFDTDNTLSMNPDELSALFVIKKDFAVYRGGNDTDRVLSFEDMSSDSVLIYDKTAFVADVQKIRPYFMPAVLVGGLLLELLFVVLFSLLWTAVHMVYLFVPALLIFVIMYVWRHALPYWNIYRVALYASIPVALISYIIGIAGLDMPPLFYTMALVSIALVNLHGNTKIYMLPK